MITSILFYADLRENKRGRKGRRKFKGRHMKDIKTEKRREISLKVRRK